MKRLFLAVLGLSVLMVSVSAHAQRNPRGAAELNLNGKKVSVEYGRPSLKGRSGQELLSKLKSGEVWRLGADKSTTFSAPTDLGFGDVTVPAGEYSLWARKEGDNSWKLVFNKQHGQWGTQHDPAQDLVAAPLEETKASTPEEMVTISLAQEGDGGGLSIQWGDMKLSTRFKAK